MTKFSTRFLVPLHSDAEIRLHSIIITLFATSAIAKSKEKKEKKHTNTQTITTKQLNENA